MGAGGRGRERSGACGAQVHTGCSRARGVRRASRGGPRVGPGASARAGRGRGRKPPALLRAGSFWLVLREELPGDPRGLKPPLGSSGPARRLRGERGRTDAFRPDPSPLPRTRWVAFLFKSDGFPGNLREASRWILWVAPELSDSRFCCQWALRAREQFERARSCGSERRSRPHTDPGGTHATDTASQGSARRRPRSAAGPAPSRAPEQPLPERSRPVGSRSPRPPGPAAPAPRPRPCGPPLGAALRAVAVVFRRLSLRIASSRFVGGGAGVRPAVLFRRE